MTTSTQIEPARLIIGEKIGPSASGETAPVHSPASEAVIGSYPLATGAEVDAAVAAARAAFAEWRAVSAYRREGIIRRATAHARTHSDRIGYLMALESGKPLAQSAKEVIGACDCIDYYAAEAARVEGTINQTEAADIRSYVTKVPVGVVAAITPWNYPVALLSWKLGPALAAGCAVIVKPTPVTPLSPSAFCRALVEGGLPPGLLGFVTGDDRTVAQHLITHPGVDKLAMTGSTAVGRRLLELVAPQLKHATLELGGHCPAIVCADADLELAATQIAYKAFRNMGQSCSSMNRIYVHRSVHDELVARLVTAAEAMTIGDGLEPGDVDLGPMCTRAARDKVEAHVADALAKGAGLACGGRVPDGRDRGHYYLPTVLTGFGDDMLLAHEETFGPVAPIAAFDDLDAAVTAANDSRYGLVSYLYTRDLATTHRVADRLEAGTVCVNTVAVNTPYAPYEGWKDSGFGVELSRRAIDEYLRRKHLKIGL